jgi:hypothetical protein
MPDLHCSPTTLIPCPASMPRAQKQLHSLIAQSSLETTPTLDIFPGIRWPDLDISTSCRPFPLYVTRPAWCHIFLSTQARPARILVRAVWPDARGPRHSVNEPGIRYPLAPGQTIGSLLETGPGKAVLVFSIEYKVDANEVQRLSGGDQVLYRTSSSRCTSCADQFSVVFSGHLHGVLLDGASSPKSIYMNVSALDLNELEGRCRRP